MISSSQAKLHKKVRFFKPKPAPSKSFHSIVSDSPPTLSHKLSSSSISSSSSSSSTISLKSEDEPDHSNSSFESSNLRSIINKSFVSKPTPQTGVSSSKRPASSSSSSSSSSSLPPFRFPASPPSSSTSPPDMAENNNNQNIQQDQKNDSSSSNVTLSSNVPSSSNYIQPPKYQNPPQQFTFVPQNPALSSKTEKNHSPPPLPPQKNNVHYSHQKSYSMPQPQPQNPPEDLIQSLFGSHASSMSISEETLRAALQLKTEQERTKQEFYRLELQRKNAEILQNAIHNNIPQTMFPILFQHDQDHSSYQNQLHSNNLNQPMAPPTDSTSSPTSDNVHYSTTRNNHQRNLSLPPQPTIIPSEYQQRVLGPQNFKSSSTSQNTLSRHHGHHASLSSIPSTHYSSTPGPAIGQQSVFHSNPLYNNMQSSSSATRSGITRSGPSSAAAAAAAAPVPAAKSWQHNASNPKPYFPSSKNPYPANPGSPSTSVHQIIQFHHWTPNQQKNSSSTASSSPKKDDAENTATKRRRSMTTSERHSDRIGSPTPLTKGPAVSSANNNNSNPGPANNSQTSAMASATAHSKRRGLHSRHRSETSVLRGDSLSKMSLYSSSNNVTPSSSSSSLASLTNSTSIKNLQNIQGNDVSGPANHLIHLGNHTPSLPPPAHQNRQLSSSPSSPLRNNVTNNLSKSANSNVSDATATDSESSSSSIDSMSGGTLLKASPLGNTTQKVSTLAAVLNGSEPSNVANHNTYPSYHRHQNSTDSFNFLASVAADSQRLASPAKPSKHSSPGIGAKGTHSSSNSVSLGRFPSSPSEISAASAAAAAVAVAVGTRSASFIDSSALGYATNTASINTINKHERGAVERLNPDFSYPPKPASITRDDHTNSTDSSKAPGIKSANQDNGDQDVTMEDQSFQPSQSQHSQNLHSHRLDTITESIPRTSYLHSPSPTSPQKRNANDMNRNEKDDASNQNDNKGAPKPLNTASEEQKCKKLGVGFIISESD